MDPKTMQSLADQLNNTAQYLRKEANTQILKDLEDDPNGLLSPQWYRHFNWEYNKQSGLDILFCLYPKPEHKETWEVLINIWGNTDHRAHELLSQRVAECGLKFGWRPQKEELRLHLEEDSNHRILTILTNIDIENSEELYTVIAKKRDQFHEAYLQFSAIGCWLLQGVNRTTEAPDETGDIKDGFLCVRKRTYSAEPKSLADAEKAGHIRWIRLDKITNPDVVVIANPHKPDLSTWAVVVGDGIGGQWIASALGNPNLNLNEAQAAYTNLCEAIATGAGVFSSS